MQTASIDLSDRCTNCIIHHHHTGSFSARDNTQDQKLRREMNDLIKDKAILQQKVELLELQLTEAKEKQNYFKANYDNLLTVFNRDQESQNSQSTTKVEFELEIKFLRKENQELKENQNQQNEYLMKKVQELSNNKQQVEKDLTQYKFDFNQIKTVLTDFQSTSRKSIQDLQTKIDIVERDKQYWIEKVELIEKENDQQIQILRQKHQEDYFKLKNDYEQSLSDIKVLHQKDKQFLEDLLKRNQDKVRRGNTEASSYLEMENKYLRDIKDLNDSFDEYKRHVERHIQQINNEKNSLLEKSQELETQVSKLKQTMRNNTNHHEMNSKRMREKIARSENEIFQKSEELTKIKNKVNNLKNQIQKMEIVEKKLKNLIVSKDSFIQNAGSINILQNNTSLINRTSVLGSQNASFTIKGGHKNANQNSPRQKKNRKSQVEPNNENNYPINGFNEEHSCSNIVSTYDSIWQNMQPNTVTNQHKCFSGSALGGTFKFQTRSMTPSNITPFISNNKQQQQQAFNYEGIQIQDFSQLLNSAGNNSIVLNQNKNKQNDANSKSRLRSDSNSVTRDFQNKVMNFFQPQSQNQDNKQSFYRNHSSQGLMRSKMQIADDIKKLKIIIDHCSQYECSNCQLKMGYTEFLQHCENGFNCQLNDYARSESNNSVKTNIEFNSLNKRKKSVNRESLIFKNSFVQNIQNNLVNKPSVERYPKQNNLCQNNKQNNLLESYSEQFQDQSTINIDENDNLRKTQFQLKNKSSLIEERDDQILKLNKQITELSYQLHQAKQDILDLQDKLKYLEGEKEKNEKDMQNEIRFLLQQLISFKENFQLSDVLNSKSSSRIYQNPHKQSQNLPNFTISLMNTSSSGSIDKGRQPLILEEYLDETKKDSKSPQYSESSQIHSPKGSNFQLPSCIRSSVFPITNLESQLSSLAGSNQNCISSRLQNVKIDPFIGLNQQSNLLQSSVPSNTSKRSKDQDSEFHDKLINVVIKQTLEEQDENYCEEELDEDQSFNMISERMSEQRIYDDMIQLHNCNFTPSQQGRKSIGNHLAPQLPKNLDKSLTKSISTICIPLQQKQIQQQVNQIQDTNHQKNSGISDLEGKRKQSNPALRNKNGNKTDRIIPHIKGKSIASYSQAANVDQVNYNKYELDGTVKDLMWCGSNNDAIIVLTQKGTIYRSRDRGYSWKKLQAIISKAGQEVADEGQQIGQVSSMMQSPVDDNLVVFIGTHGINWVTDDCGATVRGLNSGKKIHEFQFHPTERTWALAATWTDCSEFGDEPCKIYKELYVTKDLGVGWQFLKEYVYDFGWAYTKSAQDQGYKKLPKERILITHDPTATGHQRQNKVMWSPVLGLYYSDDWFETKKLLVSGGNSLIKTENYVFCAKAQPGQVVSIFVASLLTGFTNYEKCKLPNEVITSKTFTVMDTSEQTVFLHIQSSGVKVPMGNVYMSDGSGISYSQSIEHVIKGVEFVDFEKINSLEGVFIANKFDIEKHHSMKARQIKKNKGQQEGQDFNEEEIDEDKLDKMQRNQQADMQGINKKQQKTRKSVQKTGEEIDFKDLDNNVRTFITHNKGGKWELIRPPPLDAEGKTYKKCVFEEGCSLHLHIYSSNGLYPPPYSQDSSVGLIMGVGNLGKQLNRLKPDQLNTYLSRDGGITFTEVKKGPHIYEFGDHGGLLIMAPTTVATTEVLYSWNEGKTWQRQEISDKPIDVTNIIIEPYSISQQFVVYGKVNDPEDAMAPGVVITVDFKDLHEPQCKGADRPGESDSDYELWSPNDGRHGENKCFLGQQITFIRRKQDVECYNGEELERQIRRESCTCGEMDYECDVGYVKTEQGTCQKIEVVDGEKAVNSPGSSLGLNSDQVHQCDNFGFYTISQGYRKIPGDRCIGGIDLNPIVYSCSYSGMILGLISLKSLLSLVIFGGILYYGWPVIEAILIALPLPDPKEITDKLKTVFQRSGKATTTKRGDSGTQKPQGKAAGYQEGFNQAPESLEEEEDDDDDDVGKPIILNNHQAMNYDSDEEKHNNELISLGGPSTSANSRDRIATAAEQIPKLQKPL